MADAPGAAAPNVDILLNGKEAPDSDLQSYYVHRDMNQPDEAVIVLSNQGDVYNKREIGEPVEIKVGNDSKSVFKGEIAGKEPAYLGGGKTTIVIRAYNTMHRMLGARTSFTYKEASDEDMFKKITDRNGMKLKWDVKTAIKYKHVYQHNLSDLEFLRVRAARIGAYMWCVDKELFVKQPEFSNIGPVKLSVAVEKAKDGSLRKFKVRQNGSSIVNRVEVRGWDPDKKEEVIGVATPSGTKLGKKQAHEAASKISRKETFVVDQPIASKEEAEALAKARLLELSMTFMTGEATIAGNPEVDLDQVIEIAANEKDPDDPFNGKYYIVGVSHQHTLPKAGDDEAGYVTILRLARNGEG